MQLISCASFEQKYIPEPMSGCWLWLGCESGRGGYGTIQIGGKQMRAHRVSYQIHKGDIPAGMLVLHRCDNPACVNPNHLFVGTNQDNSDDKLKKGRQAKGKKLAEAMAATKARGARNSQNRLSEDQVMEIFLDSAPQRKIACRFGVSQRTVAQIKLGVTWSWLTGKLGGHHELR